MRRMITGKQAEQIKKLDNITVQNAGTNNEKVTIAGKNRVRLVTDDYYLNLDDEGLVLYNSNDVRVPITPSIKSLQSIDCSLLTADDFDDNNQYVIYIGPGERYHFHDIDLLLGGKEIVVTTNYFGAGVRFTPADISQGVTVLTSADPASGNQFGFDYNMGNNYYDILIVSCDYLGNIEVFATEQM